jgi:hypothetical protein
LTFTAPLCTVAQPAHHRFFLSDGSPRLGACGDSRVQSLSLRTWLPGDSMQIGRPLGLRIADFQAERTARPPLAPSELAALLATFTPQSSQLRVAL